MKYNTMGNILLIFGLFVGLSTLAKAHVAYTNPYADRRAFITVQEVDHYEYWCIMDPTYYYQYAESAEPFFSRIHEVGPTQTHIETDITRTGIWQVPGSVYDYKIWVKTSYELVNIEYDDPPSVTEDPPPSPPPSASAHTHQNQEFPCAVLQAIASGGEMVVMDDDGSWTGTITIHLGETVNIYSRIEFMQSYIEDHVIYYSDSDLYPSVDIYTQRRYWMENIDTMISEISFNFTPPSTGLYAFNSEAYPKGDRLYNDNYICINEVALFTMHVIVVP
jgi:hypothetical protein